MFPNAYGMFLFGSRVYGTHDENSDWDYVVVLPPGDIKTESHYNDGRVHYQIYSYDEFMLKINAHDIMALECISLDHHVSKQLITKFTLNKNVLRESISTIANNSWVKAKKKLTVSGDYDKKAGMKSAFHSIRILEFGIQVAQYGKITDFTVANWIWFEIEKLGELYDYDVLWNKINEKFKKTFNETSSRFKALAPKNLQVRDTQRTLKTLLEKNNCYTPELLSEIVQIFER